MSWFDLNEMPERTIIPGYHARFVHGDVMTLAFWRVDAGSAIPEHSHPHEQIMSLLEGRFEFAMDGQVRTLDAGAVVVIPGDRPHGGRALSDCRILDAFHPPREEYR